MSDVIALPAAARAGLAGDRRYRPAVVLLAAYVLLIPIGSVVDLPFSVPLIPDTLSSVVGVMVGAALLHDRLISEDRIVRVPPAALLWIGLLGHAALSYSWSINRSATLDGVVALTSLIGLALVIVSVPYSRRDLRLLELSLIGSGAMAGCVAVAQYLTDSLGESGTNVSRFALVADDPNITAAALLLPAAASLAGVLSRSERVRDRMFPGFSFVLCSIGVVLTASRGGLIALVCVALVLVERRVGWRALVAGGAMVVGLVFFAELPVEQRGVESTGRDSIWRIAVVSCSEECWFGSGMDTFPDVHERVALARPDLAELELRFESHNLWLGTLVELGIVAAVTLMIIVAAALATAHKRRDRFGDIALAGLVGVLVANVFVANLEFKYFWLAIAVATLSQGRESVERAAL